jgi:hypothetical protein
LPKRDEPAYIEKYKQFSTSGRSFWFAPLTMRRVFRASGAKATILSVLNHCGFALVKVGRWNYRLEWISAVRKHELERLGSLFNQ